MPSTDVEAALAHWPQAPKTARPLAAGHINDTYVVGAGRDAPGQRRYVLQRLNRAVFPNPRAVMRNLAKIVGHEGGKTLVAPIRCENGESCAVLDTGDVWRLFPWVPSRTFQTLPDALLTVAGAAFGGFLRRFADFPHRLEPVIEGFHDLGHVLRRFDAAPPQLGIDAEMARVDALRAAFAPGKATRVIHGDCKINNLLFHPTQRKVAAVIDLDTAMLGDPAWDFGDLVRSAFIGTEETAAAQPLSLPRFKRLCQGFAQAYGPTFGAGDDVPRYAAAPAYMSFMLAIRFLTDHMEGDRYFKVQQRGENLRRARSQLDLAERFHDARRALAGVLEGVAENGALDRDVSAMDVIFEVLLAARESAEPKRSLQAAISCDVIQYIYAGGSVETLRPSDSAYSTDPNPHPPKPTPVLNHIVRSLLPRLPCTSIAAHPKITSTLRNKLLSLPPSRTMEDLRHFLFWGKSDHLLTATISKQYIAMITVAYVNFVESIAAFSTHRRPADTLIPWIVPSESLQAITSARLDKLPAHAQQELMAILHMVSSDVDPEWRIWLPRLTLGTTNVLRHMPPATLRAFYQALVALVRYVYPKAISTSPWEAAFPDDLRPVPTYAMFAFRREAVVRKAITDLATQGIHTVGDLQCLHPQVIRLAKESTKPLVRLYVALHRADQQPDSGIDIF